MRIISHRGFWLESNEKNTVLAFQRSFESGYGTETDIRDLKETLVISHDMPKGAEITVEDFFSLLKDRKLPLALNMKADGLAYPLKQLLEKYHIDDYFVFDMSIPDMLQYLKQGIRVFTRVSDIEKVPCCYEQATGVWLDAFYQEWYQAKNIFSYLRDKKEVSIVSSELHKRDPLPLWSFLKKHNLHLEENIILCTDFPTKATEFF